MPKTTLAHLLARLVAEEEAAAGLPSLPLLSRRQVLRGAAATLALGAVARPRRSMAQTPPRTAVVGAGLGGLCTAAALNEALLPLTVYEASDRIGGRTRTDTDSFTGGQFSEHCGEYIDWVHIQIRTLIRNFGLKVARSRRDQPAGAKPIFMLDGTPYLAKQARRDIKAVMKAARADRRAAKATTTYDEYTDAGQALDQISVWDWIDTRVPGGHGSPMGRLLDVVFTSELGLDTREQSALNAVYFLVNRPNPNGIGYLGRPDERFVCAGGVQRLVEALAGALPDGSVELNARLTAITRLDDGTYRLSFDGRDAVVVDRVALTLPFSVLRTIDFGAAGFDERKTAAINELGYGTGTKLTLQFTSRPWRKKGPWGSPNVARILSDAGFQSTWEETRGQKGSEGILACVSGGSAGAALGDTSPAGVRAAAEAFLARLETVLPGVAATWNGRATLSAPAEDPLQRGSVSCHRVGQYVKFRGVEAERSGNCHFAGEHTSLDYRGTMEGAAVEGVRCGLEIIGDFAGKTGT
ncbi:MAG: FAD-dependent oxidoreductase [bacterium]|nr:FAD-dependent oxidoreductase [bacterium]